MFDLIITTGLRANTFLLIGVGIVACFAAGRIWRRFGSREFPTRAQATSLVLIVIILMIGLLIGRRPDWDEIEHIHTAWLMHQGLIPYSDFFQNHPPGLWLLLSPIMDILPKNGMICDFIRTLALALSGCILWVSIRLARHLWHERGTGLMVTLLVLGQAVSLELYNLRPDLLANLLALGGVWCLFAGNSSRRFLGAGLLMGIAFSITPRLWFLFPWILLWLFWEALRGMHCWRQVAAFAGGAIGGLIPLALYLFSNSLTKDFVHWTYLFNISGDFVAKGHFPLVVTGLAAWGCIDAMRSSNPENRARVNLLVFGFILSAACYTVQPNHDLQYGQQFFGFLAAVLAAGPAVYIVRRLIIPGRMTAILLALAFVLWQPLQAIQHWVRDGGYLRGRAEIARLMEIADGESVVCVPPGHPIFAANATFLSHPWQLYYWLDRPDVRIPLKGIAADIIQSKPVIILDRPLEGRPALIDILKQKKIITLDEYETLRDFLASNYELIDIGFHKYWVRRNRLD
ncbi:MAG: hypothetical protein KJ970_04455 [Candidatus Eisenbacteria bacterium]|uniref:Glycosyltransferase RgtA/B/C/D-like domain-containing protein n=1 Tax=Eiseniibacteriota bacterium TaxID=2212470 RepID=A0A948W2N3_UNCEI|nr:hypothetical protein [Candidatus Eisenbacteria bacterium]MBU1950773.1 hypothetical protein [Candidatus Eisenbacteria bacterium]MBU2690157.1 hypothetical protein [Candidatus Eisenbacteria bacterium]